jgi:hypothetical protein
MWHRSPETLRIGERGVALPMALMTLLLLSTLALAFAALAQSEPTIAANHRRTAQAHAFADSGIERALWALTHATATHGFGGDGATPNVTIGATAGPPYDGSEFLEVGPAGGFHLTVSGTDPNLRVARVVGWAPTSNPADPRTKARSEVMVTLAHVRNLAREAPCALCAGGALTLTTSVVDARGSESTDCSGKVAAASAGPLVLGAGTRAYGFGAPDTEPNLEGRDWRQHGAPAWSLRPDDLATLKSLAIERGTYVRPPSEARMSLAGVSSGLVFVDTPAGTAITPTNVANVAIGPALAAQPPFRGWLIVNGNVVLESGADVDGLLYATNTIVTEGPAAIDGAALGQQALGVAMSVSDLTVRFDCALARGAGRLPSGWFMRAGTYCDGTAGC